MVAKKNGNQMAEMKASYPPIYTEYAQRIEKKAYELYERRGRLDGHDLDDWFEAQKIVETEMITK